MYNRPNQKDFLLLRLIYLVVKRCVVEIKTGLAQSMLREVGNVAPFPHSQFPYPLNQSLFGKFSLENLQHRYENNLASGHEDDLPLFLGLAEAIEASQPDKETFFYSDRDLRGRLLGLNSTDGWALVWGKDDERTTDLAARLQQAHLQVYLVLAEESGISSALVTGKQYRFLGARPTSSIYFYQAIVRYPHIYGQVPLGDTHEVADFIQDYGPGVMLLARDSLSPVEEALFLGGLYLEIPAIVPSTVSTPYGNVIKTDNLAAMVSAAQELPNMRFRRRLRFQVDVPYNFDLTFTSEEIKEGPSIGDTDDSSFVVINLDKGDGVEVVGEPGRDVAIEISVGDIRVDITMTDYLEEFAARLPGYMEGVSSTVKGGCPTIRWHPELQLQMEQIGQSYYDGLKTHFNIERLKIRLVFQSDLLEEMKMVARSFRERRQQALDDATEESEPFFYACTRCHSFALDHACIITPERPPQCGSRSWAHVKTRAVLSDFDSGGLSKIKGGPALHSIVNKGQLKDENRAEYEGVNNAIDNLTDGRTRRVFLHSLFEHPHTACSCFRGVAFYIEDVDGIGLMDRIYKGTAPDGRNWDEIANAAAGKQSTGYAAWGKEYLKSKKFLRGDGGWQRVVWMPQALKAEIAADKSWIATEADVSNSEELADFLKYKRD